MSYTKAQEQASVARGAKLLDKILPGWFKHVKLDKLEMHNDSLCMMGQLFGTGVESKLARKMYPEEMSTSSYWLATVGYRVALIDDPSSQRKALIPRLLAKLGINMGNELRSLHHACAGHDNRCIWAEEVAKRRAQDEQSKADKRVTA